MGASRSSQHGLIYRLERSLRDMETRGMRQRPAADGLGLIACFHLPVPVPDSPRQAVAAGREVQELVATEDQISRLRLTLARLALVALAQVTGNLIAAERGLRRLLPLLTLLVDGAVFCEVLLPVTVMTMPPR
jgi:hypothetical protein